MKGVGAPLIVIVIETVCFWRVGVSDATERAWAAGFIFGGGRSNPGGVGSSFALIIFSHHTSSHVANTHLPKGTSRQLAPGEERSYEWGAP